MMSRHRKVADLLRRFLENDLQPWEFDDFLSSRQDDPAIEAYRIELARIPQSFPAGDSAHYASPEGLERIRAIADRLDPAGQRNGG